MENISVIGLPTERLGEAARLLARCFYANPNFTRSLAPTRCSRAGAW
jgi:hypothetical protein